MFSFSLRRFHNLFIAPALLISAVSAHAQNPTITLTGHVFYSTGQPAAGATVTLTKNVYIVNPNEVTTATTITDGGGHYQFTTYSRCSVVEDFRASIGSYIFQGGTSTSGCVLGSNDSLNFPISLGSLENVGTTGCNGSVGRPVNV